MADQPPGQSVSLDDIIATARSLWQAFIIPSALGAWGLWRYMLTRKDTHEERERIEREAIRASVGAREIAYMDRIEKESARKDADLVRERDRNLALEQRTADLEHEKDVAYEIARGWKTRCHALKHDLGGARSTINVQRVSRGEAERDWPDEALPPLEGIVQDNARRAAERGVA